MIYGIGKMIELEEDMELKAAVTGETKVIKKGNKMYVMASEEGEQAKAMFLNGKILMLGSDVEVKGFSVVGLSDFVCHWLEKNLPIKEALDGYDVSMEELRQEIEDALEELSFYNHEGNVD